MEPHDTQVPRLTGRPSANAAEELGERLLTTAFDCFTQGGFAATSIEMIAAAANIHKRTIYRRYEDKTGLFQAVVRWKFNQFTLRYEGGSPPGEELGFLRDLLRHLFDFALEPSTLKMMKVIIGESDRFPVIVEQVFYGRTTKLASILEDVLLALSQSGTLRIADHLAASTMLMPDLMSDAWLKHMLNLNPLDTPDKRERYFQDRWHAFLTLNSGNAAP